MEKMLAPFRQLRWKFWVTFLLACLVAEGGEFVFHKFGQQESGDLQLSESLITASGFYQRIITARRNPIDRFTAIVEIDPKIDYPNVNDSNVCAEREFLAHLLTRINIANPAMIVIDKYFGRDTCGPGDVGTKALLDVITKLRATRPIVVGSRTDTLELQSGGKIQARSYIVPQLPFGPEDSQFREGIINIASDNRRLPLQWLVSRDESSARNGVRVVRDTFALAVAKLYDPDLLRKSPRLARLIDAGEQPFIGFLDVPQFKESHLYASAVCSSSPRQTTAAPNCENEAPLPSSLRNRIVLIGENDDRDEFSSIVGRIPGFYLQANYIEALLDDRYYRSGGPVLDFGSAFLFLVGLELILIVYHHDVLRVVMLTGALVIGIGMLLYLTIMLAGIYIDPWGVSATAVLIKSLHFVFGFVKRDPMAAPDGQG
jgi:CHASE2 domain-containing sensor protein